MYQSILIHSRMINVSQRYAVWIGDTSNTFSWIRFIQNPVDITTRQWLMTPMWGSLWKGSVCQMLVHTGVVPKWDNMRKLPPSLSMSVS